MGAAAAARPRDRRGTAPHPSAIPHRQGGAATSCSARAVCSHPSFVRALKRFFQLGIAVFGAAALAATAVAAPPGTPIANRGEVSFVGNSGLTTIYSNQVALVVAPPPSRAALTLLRSDPSSGTAAIAQPTQCFVNGVPTPLP